MYPDVCVHRTLFVFSRVFSLVKGIFVVFFPRYTNSNRPRNFSLRQFFFHLSTMSRSLVINACRKGSVEAN